MKRRIISIVGLPGAGKSEVADYFIGKKFGYIRLGQIALDELMKSKMEPGEKSERKIREGFRKKYGMAAFAILNMPKIKRMKGDVVIDGLYSWEEYTYFKKNIPEMIVIAVYAKPDIRYHRLTNRGAKHGPDPKMKYRSFTLQEAVERDRAEIENLNKGGPIAMADYTIINEGTKSDLADSLNQIWRRINAKKN